MSLLGLLPRGFIAFSVITLLVATLPAKSARSHPGEGQVETVGAFSDPHASESVRNALEKVGHRVTLDGTAACEIWFRERVPTRAKVDVPGAIYTELAESTVVGVVKFLRPTTDFRGQTIGAGVYTMRYSLHPQDGNHMGISPYRDFLLLLPASADQDIEMQYKFEELARLSAKVSGANHPAPLSLVATDRDRTVPAVAENEHHHTVFFGNLKTGSGGTLPIAFIIKGVAEQ